MDAFHSPFEWLLSCSQDCIVADADSLVLFWAFLIYTVPEKSRNLKLC